MVTSAALWVFRAFSWLAVVIRLQLAHRKAMTSRRIPPSFPQPWGSCSCGAGGISAYGMICSSPISKAWKLLEKAVRSSYSSCCECAPCFCDRRWVMMDLCQLYNLQRQAGVPTASRQRQAWPVETDFVFYFGASLRSVSKGLLPLPSNQSVWKVVLSCRHKEEILSFIHLLTLDLRFHCNMAAFSYCWVFAGGCCFIAHPKHGYVQW